MATKEEPGVNVGVDGQTWQGLVALTQMGPPYLVQRGETATCKSLTRTGMTQVREVFEE